MKSIVASSLILAAFIQTAPTETNSPVQLTHEHVDLRVIYTPTGTNNLKIVAHNGDAIPRVDHESDKVVLVAVEASQLAVPSNSSFSFLGNPGDPIWVLPQSRESDILYLGFSAEGIGYGIFQEDKFDFRLLSVRGPGNFFVWQATSPTQPNVKMNSADGISETDNHILYVAGHDHVSWGFSAPGVYCVTFQASGTLLGQTEPIYSEETTFLFHILPLAPFDEWQFANFPFSSCECEAQETGDPDGDNIPNLVEYALNLDPNLPNANGLPTGSLVNEGGTPYGALTYTRVKAATDISYQVLASNALTAGPWTPISEVASVVDEGETERVTIRDSVPANENGHRYYRLKVIRHGIGPSCEDSP